MAILFKNTQVLDVIGGRVLEGQDVLIEDGRIERIQETGDFSKGEVIEGSDLLLTPGFINAHTHLGMSYFRNYADDLDLDTWLKEAIWPMEAHLDGDDIYWGSLLSLAEQIRSGTTCFCDMYYFMDRVGEAALDLGMRGVLTRGLTSGPDENRKLEEVKDLYKNFHGRQGLVRVVPAPHAIYTCSGDFIKKIFALARDLDGIIHIHASETKKEVQDSIRDNQGRTPIDYLLDLGMGDLHTIAAHCVYMTEEEMDRVDVDKFFPIYNPSSNLKLASGFTPVTAMIKKGLVLGLGTDGDSSNNNQDILEEIHLGSLVNKALEEDPEALPALEAIRMATINGAKALGWEDEIGSLEEGKAADIAVFDLRSPSFTPRNKLISALAYSASSEDVAHVLIKGDFVMKDRKLVRMDLGQIIDRVNERMVLLEKKAAKA